MSEVTNTTVVESNICHPKQTVATKRPGPGGKENIRTQPAAAGADSDDEGRVAVQSTNNSLNITPPGSPTGKARVKGGRGRPRAVRGANRTRQTEQALKRILGSGQRQLEHQAVFGG